MEEEVFIGKEITYNPKIKDSEFKIERKLDELGVELLYKNSILTGKITSMSSVGIYKILITGKINF